MCQAYHEFPQFFRGLVQSIHAIGNHLRRILLYSLLYTPTEIYHTREEGVIEE